jgi:hypothetical protein
MSRQGLGPWTIGLKVRQTGEQGRLSATIGEQLVPHVGRFVCHLRPTATNHE